MAGELRASDRAAVRQQLGREPTTPFTVTGRCTGGHPLVIRNAARDAGGAPFPTIYWLTCPAAVKAVSRVEAQGWIARLNERMGTIPVLAAAVDAAHRAYERERGTPGGGVGGTRAGIKCLHAHYAYHLAGGVDPIGAWVAERVEPVHAEQRSGRVAVIDQGTNSIRLLVMEPGAEARDGPTELARDMSITRLGRGVDRTGKLDPLALARTIEVLQHFCRRARALGAERIRVGATAAVRDASNREELAEAVRAHAGSELEVLPGEREAALSFLGGTFGLDASEGPFLVADIGGGSTELVVGARSGHAEHAVSLQIGSVRMTERFVRTDPPAPGELRQIEDAAAGLFDEAAQRLPVHQAGRLVAVAGTATTTQACSLGLEVYDPDVVHRSMLSIRDAERTLERFATMTNEDRAAIPVMPPGRGDVITAGAVILVTLMRRFGFDEALVSETDILDGLAFELLGVR